MSSLNVFLLGPPRLELGGSLVTVNERKAIALLAYIAVGGVRHSRDSLATMFWSEQSQPRARASLRHAIWSLRVAGLGDYIDLEQDKIGIHPPYQLDVIEFSKLVEEHRQHSHASDESCVSCQTALAEAVALYKDDFLAGFTLRDSPQFDEWQYFNREQYQQMLASALENLAQWHTIQNEWEQAIEYTRRWVALDPLNEHAQRWLMMAYAHNAQRNLALRQFETLRKMLDEEMGSHPEAETSALAEAIRLGKFEIETGVPAVSLLNVQIPPPLQLRSPSFLQGGEQAPQKPAIFVSRNRELRLLDEHLQAALSENGRIIFVTGEAGSGKTSLLAEFARRAETAHPDLICARGICNAYFGSGDAYLPFRSILSTLAGNIERLWMAGNLTLYMANRIWAALPHFLSTLLAEGSDLLDVFVPIPQLMGLINEHAQAKNPWLRKLEGISERQKITRGNLAQPMLFEETAQVLRNLSVYHPLLLIIDDLHWVDGASASLLFHLGRRLHDSRILILCAYRPSEIALGHPSQFKGEPRLHLLQPLVNEFKSIFGDIQIDLEKTEAGEGFTFVNDLLDSESNWLGADFRRALFERTRGHPLFTIELLRDLQEQGFLIRDEQGKWMQAHEPDWKSLPTRVEAVIAQRLGRLDPDSLNLLSAASVEGEEFTAQVVAHVQGLGERQVLDQLARMEKRYRLVREQGETRIIKRHLIRYQFGHALFQEYLYRRLSQGERRLLHGEVARCLDNLYGKANEAIIPRLAHHFLLAGDQEQAASYLVKAGDQAYRRAALNEAIRHYQGALVIWPESDPAGRADILSSLGKCQLVTGELEQALDSLNEASGLYVILNDWRNAGAMQRQIGMVFRSMGGREQALKHFQKAQAIFQGKQESDELARVISEIARDHMGNSEYDQAIELGDQALELARKLEVEDVVVHALTTLGVSHMALGDFERGLHMLEESLVRALDLEEPANVCRAYFNLGEILLAHSRYSEASETFQAFLSYAEKARSVMYIQVATIWLGYIDWLTGKWNLALERVSQQKGTIMIEPIPQFPVEWKIWGSTKIGQMLNDLGQPETALYLLEKWLPLVRRDSDFQTVVPHLGELLRCGITLGKEDMQQSLLREILGWYENSTFLYVTGLNTVVYACYWLAERNGPNDIEKLLFCIRVLEKGDQQFRTPETGACVQEASGCLRLTEGDTRQAGEHFRQAANHWGEINRPYDQMRSLTELGLTLKQMERDEEAKVFLEQGLNIAESLVAQLPDQEMKLSFWNSSLAAKLRYRQ